VPTCSPRGFAFARSLFFVTQFITSQEINIYEMLSSMFSHSPMFFGSSGVFLFREIAKFTKQNLSELIHSSQTGFSPSTRHYFIAVMVATESTPQSPPTTELSSPSTPSSSHIDDIGRSPCLRSSPSSDNLKGYVTPSGTWDGRSIQALPELNSLQSSGSSSTYLISRHLDGNETPLSADSGTSTDTSDGKQPIRSLCHVLHEKTTHPEPPYHVFPQKKKKTLMYIAATTGMFSSLSANIYFPALGQISRVSTRPL
jgi:hypothetical protein